MEVAGELNLQDPFGKRFQLILSVPTTDSGMTLLGLTSCDAQTPDGPSCLFTLCRCRMITLTHSHTCYIVQRVMLLLHQQVAKGNALAASAGGLCDGLAVSNRDGVHSCAPALRHS
eukprot:2730036-Amphidinium_carterae.1